MSKHVSFYSRRTSYFTALSRVDSWPCTETIFICRYVSEKRSANACTECPAVTAALRHSFPPATAFLSQSHLARNRAGDISKWIVSSISVSSALPKGPFFLPVLFRCSLRRNSSRHTLDQLAAIWARRVPLLPAIGKLDFARSDKSTIREQRTMVIARAKPRSGKWFPFLSPSVPKICMAKQIEIYTAKCIRNLRCNTN